MEMINPPAAIDTLLHLAIPLDFQLVRLDLYFSVNPAADIILKPLEEYGKERGEIGGPRLRTFTK